MTLRVCSCFCLLICLVAHAGNLNAQGGQFSSAERKLIAWQDARVEAAKFYPYLTDKDPALRWRAAIALANIGDTSSRAALISALQGERDKNVLNADAFALGVLGESPLAESALLKAARQKGSLDIFEALARTTVSSDGPILDLIGGKGEELARAQAALVLTLRKKSSERLLAALSRLAESADPEVRWRAAYAFSRCDSTLLSGHWETLKPLLADLGSSNARMFAALAAGRLHTEEAVDALVRAFKGEYDWQVRTNLLRGLGSSSSFSPAILEVIKLAVDNVAQGNDTGTLVGITALEVLDDMIVGGKVRTHSDSAATLAWLGSFVGEDPTRQTPKYLLASTLPPLSRFNSDSSRLAVQDMASFEDPFIKRKMLPGIAAQHDTLVFYDLLSSLPRIAREYQMLDLISLDSNWRQGQHDPVYRAQLESSGLANAYRYALIRIGSLVTEPEVVITALSHLEDSTKLIPEFRAEAARYVGRYLERFRAPIFRDQLLASVNLAKWLGITTDTIRRGLLESYKAAAEWSDASAMDSVRGALAALSIPIPQDVLLTPRHENINWKLLEESPDSLVLTTNRGQYFIKLNKHDAPLTALAMLQAAKNFYFNNQIFHRVVPNFVIQSGDPTGTGWGGPEYTLRTEISPARFDKEGVLGMASSGKDTEGSQWFMTLLPTPHLDTHYTVWGAIERGYEELESVQPREKIFSIIPIYRK